MKLQEYLNLKDKAEGELHANIVIAHRNCPDGAGAVVLAKKIFPDIFYIMASHDRILQETWQAANALEAGGNLIIVDIAPPRSSLPKLFELIADKKAFCGIYDHHESTKWLQNIKIPNHVKAEIVFKSDSCGTKILYDHYLKTCPDLVEFETFVKYTNDRDLWIRNHPISDEFARLHRILGDSDYIKRFSHNHNSNFTQEEKIILDFSKRQQHAREERLLRSIRIQSDSKQYKYGVLYGEGESSDILNKAIERHALEYAFLINLHTKRVSMRGRGNVDCATYAEQHGGGGHKKASGFPVHFQEPEF